MKKMSGIKCIYFRDSKLNFSLPATKVEKLGK